MGTPKVVDADLYRENGYVLLPQLFERQEVETVRTEAKQIFIAQMIRYGIVSKSGLSEADFEAGMYRLFEKDLQGFTNCGKQAQHLISLHRLSLDDRIVRIIQQLGMEFPNISTRPLLYFNSPKLAKKEVYWRLSAHQDWRSMQPSATPPLIAGTRPAPSGCKSALDIIADSMDATAFDYRMVLERLG